MGSQPAHGTDVIPELPGYRIVRQLGRGNMGVVYLAEDVHLRRQVALKLLAPTLVDGELFRQRFNRESHNAATLDHPNIIPVYAAGEAAGAQYIAMRYVPGGDLRALLETNGPLSLEQASAVIGAVADALDAAHTQGVIHRDVKPANILIDDRNGQEHYYLSDFGIARNVSSAGSLTSTGQIMGTIDYLAPEQVQGKPVDSRADLYALGCVLYHCLTGAVPFPRADIAALMWAHVHETPPPVTARRPDLPPHIDHIVAKAMAKQPEDRYPTGRALASALHALTADPTAYNNNAKISTGIPIDSPPPPVASAGMTGTYTALAPTPARASGTTSPPRRRWGLLAAGGTLALTLIAGSTIAVVKYLNSRFPTQVEFPTQAERALLNQLPPALTRKNNCARNTELDTASIQASVTCTPEHGPDSIVFTRFISPQSLHDRYNTDVTTAQSTSQISKDSGDCRSAETAEGTYTSKSGRASGRVLCYQDSGSSFIEWTDESSKILGRAMQLDSDYADSAKLRDWWARVANVKLPTPNLSTFEHTQAPPPASSPPSSLAHPTPRQAPEDPRPAPEAAAIPGLAIPGPAPQAITAGPTPKPEEATRQTPQPTNAPASPGNPTSEATTANSPTSTPSAPHLKLDGPTPDRPRPQQNGPRVPGKSSCGIDNGTYHCLTRTTPIPIYQPQETDPDAYDLLPAGEYRFLCQSQGSKYTVRSHTTHWWAWVGPSINGAWIPVIFLAGALDDEPEPGLPVCGSTPTTTTTPPTTTTTSQPAGS